MKVVKTLELIGRSMLIISGILLFAVALPSHRWEFIGWGLFQIFLAIALAKRSDLLRKFGTFSLLFGGIIMLIISALRRDTYSLVLSIVMTNIGITFLTGGMGR